MVTIVKTKIVVIRPSLLLTQKAVVKINGAWHVGKATKWMLPLSGEPPLTYQHGSLQIRAHVKKGAPSKSNRAATPGPDLWPFEFTT